MIFLELFLTFFMIGACTFGGGYAMLPLMQEQVTARWGELISADTITNFIAVSESTPGPFAINMATYVGSEVGGRNAALGRNKIPHAWDLKASLLQGGTDRGQALGKGMSCGAQKL